MTNTQSDRKGTTMIFGQVKPYIEKDPAIALREAEAERVRNCRSELNREMLRLPIEERRRRWNEYLTRLNDLTAGAA